MNLKIACPKLLMSILSYMQTTQREGHAVYVLFSFWLGVYIFISKNIIHGIRSNPVFHLIHSCSKHLQILMVNTYCLISRRIAIYLSWYSCFYCDTSILMTITKLGCYERSRNQVKFILGYIARYIFARGWRF